jgi:prepilin-type N-terminal cleavage/methylation domain-containing protein
MNTSLSLRTSKEGFTLLEILLVVGILVVIAAMSRDFYGSFVSGAQLSDNADTIIYDLRSTRDKAMNGQDDRIWGIHFVNGANDYYEIFSTPSDYTDLSKIINVTSYLKAGVSFSYPAESQSIDIIFNKISGTTTAANIILNSGLDTKTISVQGQGLVN